MNDYCVQDLILGGVKWEISDVPCVLRAQWAAASATVATATQNPSERKISNTINPRDTVVPPIAPSGTVTQDAAESMARRPADTDGLLRMVGELNHPLRAAATQTVFPNIAKNPNGLVIVTDVPGAEDDATGKILSGASGELLDKMLAAIGMSRDNVSIVPIVFWRTPGGRTPSAEELSLARPFVSRLLEMLSPCVILTLGATPAQEIANVKLSTGHGKLVQNENAMPVMPIYHPNYLLLKPSAKREVWTALQELQKLLKN